MTARFTIDDEVRGRFGRKTIQAVEAAIADLQVAEVLTVEDVRVFASSIKRCGQRMGVNIKHTHALDIAASVLTDKPWAHAKQNLRPGCARYLLCLKVVGGRHQPVSRPFDRLHALLYSALEELSVALGNSRGAVVDVFPSPRGVTLQVTDLDGPTLHIECGGPAFNRNKERRLARGLERELGRRLPAVLLNQTLMPPTRAGAARILPVFFTATPSAPRAARRGAEFELFTLFDQLGASAIAGSGRVLVVTRAGFLQVLAGWQAYGAPSPGEPAPLSKAAMAMLWERYLRWHAAVQPFADLVKILAERRRGAPRATANASTSSARHTAS